MRIDCVCHTNSGGNSGAPTRPSSVRRGSADDTTVKALISSPDASRTLLLRSSGQFTNLDEIRTMVVVTRAGVPVYMKDIAEVGFHERVSEF